MTSIQERKKKELEEAFQEVKALGLELGLDCGDGSMDDAIEVFGMEDGLDSLSVKARRLKKTISLEGMKEYTRARGHYMDLLREYRLMAEPGCKEAASKFTDAERDELIGVFGDMARPVMERTISIYPDLLSLGKAYNKKHGTQKDPELTAKRLLNDGLAMLLCTGRYAGFFRDKN